MIQSCDCRLPAMIEPLHSPQQHKSMSITSPEHIRHFPFLLVISMAHRHIPIPHQAHSGASAHKQQSQGMKWFHCLSSNTYQHIESYASCDTEYKQFSSSPSPCAHTCIISVSPLITAGLASQWVSSCENELKRAHEPLDLGRRACVFEHICMHARAYRFMQCITMCWCWWEWECGIFRQ